jgi:hypothetical protein
VLAGPGASWRNALVAISTALDDGTPSRRFVRNLALSLSGGAILAVVGATAAQAQDNGAGTASDGAGAARSGNATAVGNRSGSDTSQTAASGAGGSVQVTTQTAGIANVGVAVADTGGNTAIGNSSTNTATGEQTSLDALGGATSSGTVGNASNGSAFVSTGDASAVGNQSNTTLDQSANGSLGGILVVNQVGGVVNAGVALAQSGGNDATGNSSTNEAGVLQTADTTQGLASNSGSARNQSDGLATIWTGTASAVGNDSDTKVTQSSTGDAGGDGPGGLVLVPQAGVVVNAGLAVASSGDNEATGNSSTNTAHVEQSALVGVDNLGGQDIDALGILASNSGEAATDSDGTAEIATGAAHASGNESRTTLSQTSETGVDGLGLVMQPQVAAVGNVGVGAASTGDNTATGNEASSEVFAGQTAQLASDNGLLAPAGFATFTAAAGIASNSASATAATDGSAAVHTGAASATGSHSETDLAQDADGQVDGLGVVLQTQAAAVANAGLATATTGDNDAVGNTSQTFVGLDQLAEQDSGNLTDPTLTVIGIATASNAGELDAASDGTAEIGTGAATSVGSTSATELWQTDHGHAPGLVVDTQLAPVANLGVAAANTGRNRATGNAADLDNPAGEGGISNQVFVSQRAQILSRNDDGAPTQELLVVGPSTAANQASATTATDGTARIATGEAEARGNVSRTAVAQDPHSTVSGLGGAIGTQVAGVVNAGAAAADSGDNEATGQETEDSNLLDQTARVGSFNTGAGGTDFTVVGPATASNSADVGVAADGTARIGTGRAVATGNASSTDLSQDQHDEVDGHGLVIGTQVAGVANVGVAVANSGSNTATGNESVNRVLDSINPDNFTGAAIQSAGVNSTTDDPAETTLLGGATASSSASAHETSDGEACVCTGDAVASGNVSSTTLDQDLDLSTGSGLVVLTEAGEVLNAGLGVANTGINEATGNSSSNTVDATQDVNIDDALLEPLDGPQVASNGFDAADTSAGSGKVGTGDATATGNLSTTSFGQAATADGPLALSTLTGGTANVGAGIANAGLNSATGNDSTNLAELAQTADGSGLVANQGRIANDSDGTGIVGDPDCAPAPEAPSGPAAPSLPRTGGPIEVEAAIGLLLLLAGLGARRRARQVL